MLALNVRHARPQDSGQPLSTNSTAPPHHRQAEAGSACVVRSGGHINPAVTLGLLLANKISVMRAVCYMVSQVLGGLVGVAIVKAVWPHLRPSVAVLRTVRPGAPAATWSHSCTSLPPCDHRWHGCLIVTFAVAYILLSLFQANCQKDSVYKPRRMCASICGRPGGVEM